MYQKRYNGTQIMALSRSHMEVVPVPVDKLSKEDILVAHRQEVHVKGACERCV